MVMVFDVLYFSPDLFQADSTNPGPVLLFEVAYWMKE